MNSNERFELGVFGSGYYRNVMLSHGHEEDNSWCIAKITRCGRKRELGLVRYTGIRSRLFKTNRRGQVREINEIRQ
jgi:hypothetical protein